VAEPVGEDISRVDAKLRTGTGCMDLEIDIAMAHKDYICWEDEDGNLHGVFRYSGNGAITVNTLSRKEWDTGDWVEVKPKKLWFRGGGGE